MLVANLECFSFPLSFVVVVVCLTFSLGGALYGTGPRHQPHAITVFFNSNISFHRCVCVCLKCFTCFLIYWVYFYSCHKGHMQEKKGQEIKSLVYFKHKHKISLNLIV